MERKDSIDVSEKKNSYQHIFKSTSVVGGAQILNILIGIFRTKIIAILLGPIGIGYAGVLQNIIDLIRQITGFGINFSGTKDVAESNATNDKIKIAETVKVLKRWAFWTGVLGTLVAIFFCIPLSRYSFGDNSHALSIAAIAVTILISSISGGQIAVLQGLRKIKLMAKATFYGAILSTLLTLPLYWLMGINGIVPGMILTSLGAFSLSWWFTRDIKLEKVNLSFNETVKRGGGMAKLGFFITITSIMATITLYVVRAFLLKKMNIDAVGCFQACWMISTLYLGIILNAMLADFFPRLTEISKDNVAVNRLINEQLEIAFLIASPMIIGIITFSRLILTLLYSSKFLLAIPVLQWFIAGTFFTIISWPLGVLFLAKNKGIYSFITESLWSIVFLLFLFLGWNYYGFKVMGYAYVLACAVRFILVYLITKKMSNFRFTIVNLKYSIFFGVIVVIALINVTLLSHITQYIISILLVLTAALGSYVYLNRILNIKGFIKSKFN